MIAKTKCKKCRHEKEWNVKPGYSFKLEKCEVCGEVSSLIVLDSKWKFHMDTK
jgi:rRNA maturation protein Nop10